MEIKVRVEPIENAPPGDSPRHEPLFCVVDDGCMVLPLWRVGDKWFEAGLEETWEPLYYLPKPLPRKIPTVEVPEIPRQWRMKGYIGVGPSSMSNDAVIRTDYPFPLDMFGKRVSLIVTEENK